MQDLILLHGALGAKSQFDGLIPLLNKDYTVHTFNFSGHGGTKQANHFDIGQFSNELAEFIYMNELDQPKIFGYSMGGYVALCNAAQYPGLSGDIVTLGTKFDWNPESAKSEASMLKPDVINEKVPRFAEYLKQLHGENNWKSVLYSTAEMMLDLGEAPLLDDAVLEQVSNRTTLNLGTLDNMVSERETRYVQDKLKNVSFRLVDACPHPIQKIPPETLKQIIDDSIHQ